MSDDFLTKITEAEEQAKKTIEKAKKKMHSDLDKEKRKLAADRAKKLEVVRAKGNEQLAEKRKAMREEYEKMKAQGVIAAKKLITDSEQKMDQSVKTAQVYLLNELL